MKILCKYLIFVFFVIIALISCKKKNTDDAAYNAAIAKLVGKWNFVNSVTNQYHTNADHITTVPGSSGDHMDFTSNGRVNLSLFSNRDTSKYTLIGDRKLVFDDVDNFDLKTLTATELVLYRKIVYSASAYKEETYNLKK